MPEPQSKDEALEAIDFIVNVLKEHEKDLDKLINRLGTMTENLGKTGKLSKKVGIVEQNISDLQGKVSTVIKYLSKSKETPVAASQYVPMEQKPASTPQMTLAPSIIGPPLILRCKHWVDFKSLAQNAQALSFLHAEGERSFQTDALKGNQIMTCGGELPGLNALLKTWLSKQLAIPETQIVEGGLAIG
jgi:hypothetical protein